MKPISINWEDVSGIEPLPDIEEESERERSARLEREIQAQLERERLAQLERERMAQEERERMAELERERLVQLEREEKLAELERVRQTQERREQERPEPIRIAFNIRERCIWRTANSILVEPEDPSMIERTAKKYMRKQIRLFDADLYPLKPEECFQAAIEGGNAIYLIPEAEIDIGQENVSCIHEIPSDAELGPGRKRGRQL
jgi:hypothetical protein